MQSRWTDLGKAKLAGSGLTTKQATELAMYEIVSAATLDTRFDPLPAIVIPYLDRHGKPAKSHPAWPNFYRIRYLAKGNSFKDLATEKSQRYAQPPKTGVCAYLPAILDWDVIAKDTETAIFITEGEFKAAAACASDWATIGLGGVWNFRRTAEGLFFLPELEDFKWIHRQVYIVFDSDYATNPNVCAAINRLAEELEERGALVAVMLLPDVLEDGKTGLDDYLLEASDAEFQQLMQEAQPLGQSRALWKLNKEVVYVNDPGLVIALDNGLKMTPSAFKEHSHWSTQVTAVNKVNAEGNVTTKKEQAAPLWLRWPLRKSAKKVTYSPGEPRMTDDGLYNQWTGWGTAPKKGSVEPWLQLTKFLFKDMEKGILEHFYDWCAYPIQNPGIKMFTCVVMWGPEEGTGKSFIGYTLGRIYGTNFKELTDDELDSDYTSWAENRQFVMGDEITGNDNRQFANKLKRLITQRTMTVNVKHIPQFEIPDCINYFFTSNSADAFFISDKSRRYLVVEVEGNALEDKFYANYEKWLWGEGAAALHQWLLARQISKSFNPSGRAPDTSAKQRMVRAGKGELTAWIDDLLAHPAQMLATGKMRHTKDLWSANELLSFYEAKHQNSKVTAIGLGKMLSNAGVPQAAGGAPLRAPDGSSSRYFILRNVDRWRKVTDRKKLESDLKKPAVSRLNTED